VATLARGRATLAVGLALLGATCARDAGAAIRDREAALRELLAASGLAEQLAQWPELNVLLRDRARAELDPRSFALLERAVSGAFQASVLAAGIASRRAAGWSEPHVAALEAWYASPRGRALRAAEAGAATPEALRTLPVFLSRLSPRELPRPRREAARRLDRATGRTAATLAVAIGVSRGLAQGLVALRCAGSEEAARLAARERARLARLAGVVQDRVVTALLFAYRDLPTSDLDRYAVFLESEAGRWLFSSLRDDLESTLADALERLHEELAPAVTSRCAAAPARGSAW
jgi:hypothetical protein